MKTLVAGPWIGEFGWEVAVWAPVVHAASKDYDSTVVVGQNAALYPFATQFVEHIPFRGHPDRWLRSKRKPKTISLAIPGTITHLVPNKRTCTKHPRLPVSYGVRTPSRTGRIVVIHARTIGRYRSAERNWKRARWVRLVDELSHTYSDLTVYWIGLRGCADYIPGAHSVDCRGWSLLSQIDVLRHAHVCVGTSSGPMHLASAVGCPHVVMTSNEYRKVIKGTNKDRYERFWNPLRTPVTVLDKWAWQTPVNVVLDAVCDYLER